MPNFETCTGFCVAYILNKSEVKLKYINFINKMLQYNQFLNERIWIVKSFQTRCQLSKLIIRHILFKTKLTSLVNAQGLIDSVRLKNDYNNDRSSGAITDLKPFGAVYGVF